MAPRLSRTAIRLGTGRNNIWSLGGTTGPGGTKYATFLAQPFFNYNFGEGWFAATAPVITDNELGHGQTWTAPLGAEGGRIVKLADQDVNWRLLQRRGLGLWRKVDAQVGGRGDFLKTRATAERLPQKRRLARRRLADSRSVCSGDAAFRSNEPRDFRRIAAVNSTPLALTAYFQSGQ